MSAFFSKEAMKPVSSSRPLSDLPSFGLPISIKAIKADLKDGKPVGEVAITGVALVDNGLCNADETITVNMKATQYTRFLGHNMVGNLAKLDGTEDRYADSVVLLDRCYRDADGALHATSGIITTHMERGEVSRDHNIANDQWISGLSITLIDGKDRCTAQVTKLDAGEPVIVNIRENGAMNRVEIAADIFANKVKQDAEEMGASFKQPPFKFNLSVAIQVYDHLNATLHELNKDQPESVAAAVRTAADTIMSSETVADDGGAFAMLRSANGKTLNTFLRSGTTKEDVAANDKVFKRITKFAQENGSFELIPKVALQLSNQEAVNVGLAYAEYTATRDKQLSSQDEWKYLKVLRSFNPQFGSTTAAGESRYAISHLILAQTSKTNDGETKEYLRVVGSVPATNQCFSALPSQHFDFTPAPQPADEQKGPAAAPEQSKQKRREASPTGPGM